MTYKTELKNRESTLKHKNQIRKLVVDELMRQNNSRVLGETYARLDSDDSETEKNRGKIDPMLRDEENEELNEEILTAHNYNRISAKEKPKKRRFQRFNAFAAGGLGPMSATLNTATPQVKLIICQVCSKIQSNVLEEKNDLTNKDFLSAVNEQPHTAPILSQKQPIRVDKDAKKDDALTSIDTSNPFLNFFKTSIDQNLNSARKPTDELDGIFHHILFSKEFIYTTLNVVFFFTDDPIESASQVSGPRQIESFEQPTNRSGAGIKQPQTK